MCPPKPMIIAERYVNSYWPGLNPFLTFAQGKTQLCPSRVDWGGKCMVSQMVEVDLLP